MFGSKEPKLSLTKDELKAIIKSAVSEAVAGVRLKLDLGDIVEQLERGPNKRAVRHYLTWEYRFVELLKERASRGARDTYDFVDREMRGALFTADQFAVIESRRDEIARLDGTILDLGVYKGDSTKALALIFAGRTIHGFDSFEGLPEDWSHAMKGQFGEIKGNLPDMPDSVRLYKGWFEQTLPPWAIENGDRPISLLRVDCDIYSSTKTIFDTLGHLLKPGTWICFDELIGYYGWQDHEHKAFMEFIDRTGLRYEYVAYGLTYALARLV